MDAKPFWQSTTFWGAIVMVASTVCGVFKIDIGDPAGWTAAIVGIIGFGVTLYGRAKAVKRIGM